MRLGELLLSKGLLDEERLDIGLRIQRLSGEVLGEVLVKLGFLSPQDLAMCLAEQHGLPYVDLRNWSEFPEELLRRYPKELASRLGFLPLDEDSELHIAVEEPANIFAFDTIRATAAKPLKVYLADKEAFWESLERAYFFLENPTERIVEEVNRRSAFGLPVDLIPPLVDALLAEAIRRRATDIHIHVTDPVLSVFYRVDGILQYGYSLNKNLASSVISRIKVLSNLDIAEQRLPQDGSFVFSFLKKTYEIRVSTIPTVQGESLVMRILFGGSSELYRLSNLGFDEDTVKGLKQLVQKPYGVFLSVGPTGCGKSTTVYALLNEVNRLKRSVVTIEDPVEYRLNFSKQSQINERIGYNFASAGRNFMRHDPDVIFLGEIRDEETAKVAIRASITGHLVLSTLHANDALSTIPRLLDLGVDRFLLSASLLGCLSQRLVRRICLRCKEEREPTAEEREFFQSNGFELHRAFFGRGCKFCRYTGYLGRTAIGELLVVTETLKDMIYKGASLQEMQLEAKKAGMRTMLDDGLAKIKAGITTVEEVKRVLG